MAPASLSAGDSPLASRLFRRGFVCHPSADEPRGDGTWQAIARRWTTLRIGDFVLRTHPEAPVRVVAGGACPRVLIGDAFSTDGRALDELFGRIVPAGDRLNGLEALDGISGRFALLLFDGPRCFALHDAFGARSLFHRSEGGFAVASHAQLLAHAWRIRRRADIRALLASPQFAKRIVKYLPGNATVYHGVDAVVPNTFVVSTTGRTHRYWPVAPNVPATLDGFLAAGDAYFDGLVRFVAGAGYRPIFGVTGGIDSRAVFSAFAGRGVGFRGVTWLGPYLRAEERDCVASLVDRFAIEHAYLTPNDHRPAGLAAIALRNGGNFRTPSRLTQGMHALYGGDERALFIRGYGGEIIRGFYNLKPTRMTSLAAGEMARMYGVGPQTEGRISDYTRTVVACFERFREQACHASVEGLGYDPNDLFYWEHRMGMWGSAMLNEMDPAVHSFVGLNSRALYRLAFGLPEPVRLTKQLLRTIVGRNDARLREAG